MSPGDDYGGDLRNHPLHRPLADIDGITRDRLDAIIVPRRVGRLVERLEEQLENERRGDRLGDRPTRSTEHQVAIANALYSVASSVPACTEAYIRETLEASRKLLRETQEQVDRLRLALEACTTYRNTLAKQD